jgi:Rieske Fe-S protein
LFIEYVVDLVKKNENIIFRSRRNFLKAIAWGSVIPAFGLWLSASSTRTVSGSIPNSIQISSLVNGAQISGDYLIIKGSNGIQVFSALCTHLGCRLKDIANNSITCPCHGSQFGLDGSVIIGPALKSLEKVKFTINGDKLEIKNL